MGAFVRTLRAMAAGAARRCPRCRKGRMYEGFFSMRASCADCGLAFEPQRGEFTGAVMLAQGLFMVVAGLGTYVLWSRNVATHWIYAWLAVSILVFPPLVYPSLKGLWFGLLHGARGDAAEASDSFRHP